MSKNPALVAGCAFLAVLAPAARGQSGNSAVNVTFQTVATSSALPNLFYKPTPTPLVNQRPLNIAPNQFSPELYAYTGPAEIEFFAPDAKPGATPARDAGASPGYHVAGHAVFPKSGEYIVYFSPGPNGAMLASPVPKSTTDFPGGTIAFINATGLPVEVKAFDLKGVLKMTEIVQVGEVKVVPVVEPLSVRLLRMDRKPGEEFQHFLAEPNKLARFSAILMADLSISVLGEDAGMTSNAGTRASGTPSPAPSPPGTAPSLPATLPTRTATPAPASER